MWHEQPIACSRWNECLAVFESGEQELSAHNVYMLKSNLIHLTLIC